MTLNSLNFLLFFVIVFVVYYLPICRTPKFQNTWLFLASYLFYGFADWKMIPLLLGATTVFYGIGWWLKKEMERKKNVAASRITTLGVVFGVGTLLYFKYLNFFAESFAQLLNGIGLNVSWSTLNIVLPLGVSFFTFKLISYVIEIHREHIEPCTSFTEFATYVAFFPTILSGPIDRPNTFIPQLRGTRIFNYNMAVDGCRQILWGMFTKACIADNLASVTDNIWLTYNEQSGSTLLVAAMLYFIQLYADFDGYSNMAIGVSKILGIKVARNFNHPFLARNTAEFWRRWHISLMTWFRDYIYFPLGGSRCAKWKVIRNTMIVFLVSGLWHGANWTFICWGLYHACLIALFLILGINTKEKDIVAQGRTFASAKEFFQMTVTFLLVIFGWIIFRASNVMEAYHYLVNIFSLSFFSLPQGKAAILYSFPILLIDWLARDKEHALQFSMDTFFNSRFRRWSLYIVLLLFILFLFGASEQPFIYQHF